MWIVSFLEIYHFFIISGEYLVTLSSNIASTSFFLFLLSGSPIRDVADLLLTISAISPTLKKMF